MFPRDLISSLSLSMAVHRIGIDRKWVASKAAWADSSI